MSAAGTNSTGMRANSGSTASILEASSINCSMRTRAETLLPKPVTIIELVLPAGSSCVVLTSGNIVRIEFDSCRTSVFGRCTTVVIKVAG